jgi:molecular chaperone GrpE
MIQNKKEKITSSVPVLVVDEESPVADESVAPSQKAGDNLPPPLDHTAHALTSDGEADGQAKVGDAVPVDAKPEISTPSEADESETPPVTDDTGAIPKKADTVSSGSTSSLDEVAASSHSDKMAAGPALAELIATRAELRRVETERNDMLERLARRQADFENYRKRVERERSETLQRMVGDVVSKLLPVMDNMRRALEAESLLEKSESAEFRHFLRGIELIYRQLNDALSELGVEPVPAVGHPFDPHVHEAVATEHSDDYEPDTVTQELLRGYRLGEKLLRPAMVKVSTRQ